MTDVISSLLNELQDKKDSGELRWTGYELTMPTLSDVFDKHGLKSEYCSVGYLHAIYSCALRVGKPYCGYSAFANVCNVACKHSGASTSRRGSV